MIFILIELIKKLIFIACLFVITLSAAQKKWSLQECVDYAQQHNLAIKDVTYLKDAAKESYKQSIRDLLPAVTGYADYSIRYGRSVNPNDNSITNSDFFSNNYSLNGSLDVFQGFKKINTLRASKFLHNATKEDEDQQKFLLSFRVMNAYYDIAYFKGLVTISKEQLEISETNYNLVKKQIDLGIKAGADLYEAESTLLRDQLTLTQNENNLQVAKLALIQEMNLNENDISSIDIVAPAIQFFQTNNENTDSVYSIAQKTVPLIKAQQFRVKAAKKNLAAERGNYYPLFSFFAATGTGYFETNVDANNITKPFKTQIDENMSSRIGVQVNIPIFNNGLARSRVKQQKIALLREENNLKTQEQILFQEIQKLVQENNALKTEFSQSAKQALAQEQAFKVAQKRYAKGLINIMELNQAKTLFATAKNDNLQANLKLRVNNSTLNFYKGISTLKNLTNN